MMGSAAISHLQNESGAGWLVMLGFARCKSSPGSASYLSRVRRDQAEKQGQAAQDSLPYVVRGPIYPKYSFILSCPFPLDQDISTEGAAVQQPAAEGASKQGPTAQSKATKGAVPAVTGGPGRARIHKPWSMPIGNRLNCFET